MHTAGTEAAGTKTEWDHGDEAAQLAASNATTPLVDLEGEPHGHPSSYRGHVMAIRKCGHVCGRALILQPLL